GTAEERAGPQSPEAERLRKSRARVGRRSAGLPDGERDPAHAGAELEARALHVHHDAHAPVVAHDGRPRTRTECASRGQGRVVAVQVLYLGEAVDLAGPFDRGDPDGAEHEAI